MSDDWRQTWLVTKLLLTKFIVLHENKHIGIYHVYFALASVLALHVLLLLLVLVFVLVVVFVVLLSK